MKAPRLQFERMVRRVLQSLKDEKVLIPHATDEAIYNCALARVDKELEKEKQLDRDANKMVDDLERQNPNLDRRKMQQLIKKKLAEERKMVVNDMTSPERQLHFSRLIVDSIWGDELVDLTDDDQALRVARTSLAKFIKEEDNLDEVVRTKIASLKRSLHEGSPEWEIMYKKYYEEEGRRRG